MSNILLTVIDWLFLITEPQPHSPLCHTRANMMVANHSLSVVFSVH